MHEVVIFNGLNSLDFQEIRSNVIRIPEVGARLFEAQKVWDGIEDKGFNFFNFLSAEDGVFLGNIKLKSVAASIIQVGLFDRYVKKFSRPTFMVGSINGDSPMNVCAGRTSFEDMILDSHAGQSILNQRNIRLAEDPILSGITLTELAVFQWDESAKVYSPMESEVSGIRGIVFDLIEEHRAARFINIGPGNVLLGPLQNDLALKDIQVVESIEVDPMLNWFWSGVRRSGMLSLAQ